MDLQRISDYFDEYQLRVVTAESCTAGLVAATLGDMPGCGSWFECGFVTYSPEAKFRFLGVKPETVEKFNLTSEQVAREMVEGAFCATAAQMSRYPIPDWRALPTGTAIFRWAPSASHGDSSITARR